MAIVFLAVLALLAVALQSVDWDRIETALAHGPACPLRSWTGLKCAFCGMTHSWIAMLKGEWGRALHENVLGPVVLAGAVIVAGRASASSRVAAWNGSHAGFALLTLVAYAIARNLA